MRLVYSLRVRDLQHVAKKEFGHTLTDEEIEIIDDKLGDYIEWYEIIVETLRYHLKLERIIRSEDDEDDEDDENYDYR